jgi:hypothetical protein
MSGHAKLHGTTALAVISATLSGSDTAFAEGMTVRSRTPAIVLCRALVGAGYDPTTPMHVFRGETLALTVRSIGEAARLRVGSHGVGFERDPECGPRPPVRFPSRAATRHRARSEAAE